jgi:hypothetical protein
MSRACGNTVGALCYKLEDCGFDLLMSLDFSIDCGPEVNSASNRNDYQEDSWGLRAAGRRVTMTASPPSVNRCPENVGASISRNPMGHHGLLQA